MQRDMFEGFDSGSFSKAESLNDLDEITIDGRSAMVISNDDDSKIIAIEYLDSSDSEMQEFTHSEFDTLMNKNSVIFEYGGSTSSETPEERRFRYLEHDIKLAAKTIDTHQKNLEAYSDGDEIFTETDVYPDAIVLDNDVEEKIIYIELDDGEMIELPYEEVAKKFYLAEVNESYQPRDDLSPYLDLSGKEAVLKYKNNSKIKNVTVEEALNTPIKTVKRYRSDTAPKEINALKDKHDEIENKLVYKFTPKTIDGNFEQDFPSIYKEGQRAVTGNRWDNMKFIFENEKDADEYVEKKGLIYESEPEYRKRIKKEQKELDKLYDKLSDKDNLKDGGALDKEFKFDKNFVIYVPSTTDVGSRIRPTDLQSRVNLVEKYVAEKFGGFTRTETDGGYKASSGDIIEEDIVKVSVFAKDFDWNQHEDEVVNKVKEWAKLWGQEAIGFEYEGDLYYIDEEGKFMDGGEVEESLPYTATFKEGGELLGKKFKIVENLEDHTGYKKGQELTVKSIEPNSYIIAEEGDWYIGIEETDLDSYAEGGEVYAFGYVAPRKITIKGEKYNIFSHPKNMTFTNEEKLEVTKKLKDKGFVVKSRNIAPFGSEEKMWQLLVKKEYAEGGYVYGQKFEDKHGMLILQDRDKYDKDIWTARRYSGESKRNVGIVEVSESELSKMKRIYAEGGEITVDDVDEWEVVNDWASWKEIHPKYKVSYGQIVTDVNDMWAFDDLEDDVIDSYQKDYKERYGLKKWDNKEVEKIADILWKDLLETAKKENAFEKFVKQRNAEAKKRMADIPENYYFVREDNDNYVYVFKHRGTGKELKVNASHIGDITNKIHKIHNKDEALKRHFDKKGGSTYADGGIVIVKGIDKNGGEFYREFDSYEDALEEISQPHFNHLDRDSIRYYDENDKMIFAEGGEIKEYTFSYTIFDENGENIEENKISQKGSDKMEAMNLATTRIEEGLLEGEEVEIYAEGGEVEMIEIAEDGSNIPPKLIDIFSEFNEDEDPYKEMEKLRAKANEIGYDFSYGLDGTPTEFCEIPKKSWGGGIAIGTAVGGYVGYKIGRARKQKYGFETEKKIGRGVKKTFSRKKKMSKGGSISSHFEGELSFLNY